MEWRVEGTIKSSRESILGKSHASGKVKQAGPQSTIGDPTWNTQSVQFAAATAAPEALASEERVAEASQA